MQFSFTHSCVDVSQGSCEPKIIGDSNSLFWSCPESRAILDESGSWLYGAHKGEGGIHHYWDKQRIVGKR